MPHEPPYSRITHGSGSESSVAANFRAIRHLRGEETPSASKTALHTCTPPLRFQPEKFLMADTPASAAATPASKLVCSLSCTRPLARSPSLTPCAAPVLNQASEESPSTCRQHMDFTTSDSNTPCLNTRLHVSSPMDSNRPAATQSRRSRLQLKKKNEGSAGMFSGSQSSGSQSPPRELKPSSEGTTSTQTLTDGMAFHVALHAFQPSGRKDACWLQFHVQFLTHLWYHAQ